MSPHSFDILLSPDQYRELPPVVIMVGDDAFLRTEATTRLFEAAGIDRSQVRTFDGEECTWGQVHDELTSFSLFDAEAWRVAVVKSGDNLIKEPKSDIKPGKKKNQTTRQRIEKWCESPADRTLLVLHLTSLPGNTRLYSIAKQHGWVVQCESANTDKLRQWISAWAKHRHGLLIDSNQVALIVEAVGPHGGLLEQELSKLALLADESGSLSDSTIRANIGTWTTRTVWEISGAIVDGKAVYALEQLQHLLAGGETPQTLVPQIAWSLRRYGIAAQLIRQSRRMGKPLMAEQVVARAGFNGGDLKMAPQRLRRIGLERGTKLLKWLLELDLKMKGSHSHPDRAIFALEELCMKLV